MYRLYVDGSKREKENQVFAAAGFVLFKKDEKISFKEHVELGTDLPELKVLFESYAILEAIRAFKKHAHQEVKEVELRIYTDCQHSVHLFTEKCRAKKLECQNLLKIFKRLISDFKSVAIVHRKRRSNIALRAVDNKAHKISKMLETKVIQSGKGFIKSKEIKKLELFYAC